jgi:hypothetical protein
VINKRDIINFLFIISFPVYGIGTYIAASRSPTAGYFISISPHILILLFYCIDLLYKREFRIRLNGIYILMLVFQLSGIVSLFIALAQGLPEANLRITVGRSFLLATPFHAFIIVALYNDHNQDALPRLTLLSLGILLLINVSAYFGMGMTNALHSIEGRLSMPFFDGFYSGANILAITNLMLLYYLYKSWKNPLRFAALMGFFTFNLVLFYSVNSRLSILIFLMVLGLLFFKIIRARALFVLSMFTLPILLSSGVLLYHILQHPLLISLVQRADIEDVTTFNGRAYLWMDAIDWLLYDQRGLLLGNGYKGHYFLDLIPDVVKLWNAEDSHHLHLHSTSLETLVCQGVIFFILLMVLFYLVYGYYRSKHAEGNEEGAFFPVVIFLLFIMQVDTFVYLDSIGFVIFSLLMSRMAVKAPLKTNAEVRLNEYTHLGYRDSPAVNLQFDKYNKVT